MIDDKPERLGRLVGVNISDQLPRKREQDPELYRNRRYLFQFSLDQETEENRRWVSLNWPTINHWFRRSCNAATRKTSNLVTNTVRFIALWFNQHYNLTTPVGYSIRQIHYKIPNVPKTQQFKNMSYIFI